MREAPNDYKTNLIKKMEAGWGEVVGDHMTNIFHDGTNEEAKDVFDLYLLKKKILENTKISEPNKHFKIG
ncbi:MAG: hypothetical protein ABXS91_08650 [Sulfurimonas sp.]